MNSTYTVCAGNVNGHVILYNAHYKASNFLIYFAIYNDHSGRISDHGERLLDY